jgi:hypothetical protein
VTRSKEPVERRKNTRFKVHNGAYVAVGTHYDKVGRIMDISMSGLSFLYVGDKERTQGSHANIFFTEANFYLEKVPADTIVDLEITDESRAASSPVRRCGLKFGTLTPNERSQVEFFIQNYGAGEA